MDALGGKPYMMAISPWFYADLPRWGKNWLWRGDDLWYDRWQQAIELQPALVEVRNCLKPWMPPDLTIGRFSRGTTLVKPTILARSTSLASLKVLITFLAIRTTLGARFFPITS